MPAIEASSLSKRYGDHEYSLQNVDFSVPEGEIFGFLGPNGSGKTTTVRILNGLLKPTHGEVRIFGQAVAGNEKSIHRMSGVVTETAGLYESLSATDNLRIHGGLFGMRDPELTGRISMLLSWFGLSDPNAAAKRVGSFSTGMKKSLSIARALLHKPRLLFLDEPTNGLDPEAAGAVISLIRSLVAEERITVFLCTHQLKYAEEICTRYGFISKGKMLGNGTFAELASRKGAETCLQIRGRNLSRESGGGAPGGDARGGESGAGECALPITDDADAARKIRSLVESGAEIYDARQANWTLERLYLEYRREAGDAGL